MEMNSQLDLPLKRNDANFITPLLRCLQEIKTLMASKFLKLNDEKTEVILFGPGGANIFSHLDLGVYVKPTVKNLGVLSDSDFKLDKQIYLVIKPSFYQLKQISKVNNFFVF